MTDPRWALAALGVIAFLLLVLIVAILRSGASGAAGSPVSASGLWAWVAEKKTYIVGTLLLASDQAYDLGFLSDAAAWKIQKTLFAIAAFTIAAAQNRVQQGQTRAEVTQKVAAVRVAEVAQAVEHVAQTVEAPKPQVTSQRVEAPPPQPAPVPKQDFS